MTEFHKGLPSLTHIPRMSEMVPVAKSGKSVNVRPQIARALNEDEVIAAIEPYKLNGGKCGDVRMDDIRAMDIIIAHDSEDGGTIKRLLQDKALLEKDVLQQVNVELRSRYMFDKQRKIIGLNPKHWRYQANKNNKNT